MAQFATRNANPYIKGFIDNGFAQVVPAGLVPTANGRVIPNYGNIEIRDNSGQSTYHGLQTSFNTRNLFKQFTMGLSYTYSKTIDNVSEVFSFPGSGSTVLAQDPYNISSGERGLSNNNIPHAFSMSLNWDMPWMKSYDTARPFLANSHAPLNSVGTYLPGGNLVSFTNNAQAVQFSDVHWIYNTLAADKVFGTPFGVGRNTLTGPRFQRADISVYKNFAITERMRLTLRGEATNAFNEVFFGIPGNLYIDNSTATTFLNPTYNEGTPRVIKLGAKFTF